MISLEQFLPFRFAAVLGDERIDGLAQVRVEFAGSAEAVKPAAGFFDRGLIAVTAEVPQSERAQQHVQVAVRRPSLPTLPRGDRPQKLPGGCHKFWPEALARHQIVE